MSTADLYNERILSLARSREGAGSLDEPRVRVSLDNPLCGDRISLDLRLEDGRIAAIAQRTRGCLLTEAAAAVVARLAPGATPAEAAALREAVADLLSGRNDGPVPTELEVFAPVAAVKSRHACVLLPFDALVEAARAASSA
jgi:nitrogen fixation NifU-like protein